MASGRPPRKGLQNMPGAENRSSFRAPSRRYSSAKKPKRLLGRLNLGKAARVTTGNHWDDDDDEDDEDDDDDDLNDTGFEEESRKEEVLPRQSKKTPKSKGLMDIQEEDDASRIKVWEDKVNPEPPSGYARGESVNSGDEFTSPAAGSNLRQWTCSRCAFVNPASSLQCRGNCTSLLVSSVASQPSLGLSDRQHTQHSLSTTAIPPKTSDPSLSRSSTANHHSRFDLSLKLNPTARTSRPLKFGLKALGKSSTTILEDSGRKDSQHKDLNQTPSVKKKLSKRHIRRSISEVDTSATGLKVIYQTPVRVARNQDSVHPSQAPRAATSQLSQVHTTASNHSHQTHTQHSQHTHSTHNSNNPTIEPKSTNLESKKSTPMVKKASKSMPARPGGRPSGGAAGRKKFVVKGRMYICASLLGKGGSSEVYRVISTDLKTYALKVINLEPSDFQQHVGNYRMEIKLLVRLRSRRHVIQLVDAEENKQEGKIYMIFEMGSTDLSRLIKQQELNANAIRYYWGQILRCVLVCHEQRIVHLDLKPSNFVFVGGRLKIIDFGIARQIGGDMTSVVRENQVGTLNYMSPESINNSSGRDSGKFRLRRSSDIWSLGCILYQMVFRQTPFAHIKNMYRKMMAICNPKQEVKIPDHPDKALVACIRRCLDRNPERRPTISELLEDPYLHPYRDGSLGSRSGSGTIMMDKEELGRLIRLARRNPVAEEGEIVNAIMKARQS